MVFWMHANISLKRALYSGCWPPSTTTVRSDGAAELDRRQRVRMPREGLLVVWTALWLSSSDACWHRRSSSSYFTYTTHTRFRSSAIIFLKLKVSCCEYTTCSALYCASTSLSKEMPLCFTASARLIHICSWPRRISSGFVALKTPSLLHLCRLHLFCSSSLSAFSSTSLCPRLGFSSEAKNTVSGNSSWSGILTLLEVNGTLSLKYDEKLHTGGWSCTFYQVLYDNVLKK